MMIVQVLLIVTVLHITHGLDCKWGTEKVCESGVGIRYPLTTQIVTVDDKTLLMNISIGARGGICSMSCEQYDVDVVDVCSKMLTWESCDANNTNCKNHTFSDTVSLYRTWNSRNIKVWKNGPIDLSDNRIICTVSYRSGFQTSYSIRSKMVTVVAPPRECGGGLQIPVVNEGDDTNVKLQLCGNPPPTVAWSTKLPGVTLTRKKRGAQVDRKFYNLTYDFTDSPFQAKPSMCNHHVRYKATNNKGETSDGSGKLKVLFDIVEVEGLQAYSEKRSENYTCVTVNWDHFNAGQCKVRYEIQFLDSNEDIQHTEIREVIQQKAIKLDLTACLNQSTTESATNVRIRANATKSAKDEWTFAIVREPTQRPITTETPATTNYENKFYYIVAGIVVFIVVTAVIIIVVVVIRRRRDRSNSPHEEQEMVQPVEGVYYDCE